MALKGHSSYLDPDHYNDPGIPGPDPGPEPTPHGWHLLRFDPDGERVRVGTFLPYDGQDVMGCDMDEWMRDNGHYGDLDPGDFDWDGDRESVAIMRRSSDFPSFRFEWMPL